MNTANLSLSHFNSESLKAFITEWQPLTIMHLEQYIWNVKQKTVSTQKVTLITTNTFWNDNTKLTILVSLMLFLSYRYRGNRGSEYKHATGCASDACLGCLAASGHGVAKVHLPLSCGPPYSSASGMVVCSLALLWGAHLVFELKVHK